MDNHLAPNETASINTDNYRDFFYNFRERQAGIAEVYHPREDRFFFNVYCIDQKLCKEIFTSEHQLISSAVSELNTEFGSWECKEFIPSQGCGTCTAK